MSYSHFMGGDKNDRRRGVRQLSSSARSGAAAAEFAVIAPFLVFLFLGVFELARGLMIKQMLNDAARKACRTGVLPGKSNSDITAEVNNILSDNGVPTADATIVITISPSGATNVSSAVPGVDSVKVKVSIPVSDVYWMGTYFLPGSDVESESVVMLKQG
jgi:hypothetical protein